MHERAERQDGRRGRECRRTVENDEISDVCLDFLRLEDQTGVLGGAISADYDGYRLGGGQKNGVQLENRHASCQPRGTQRPHRKENTHNDENYRNRGRKRTHNVNLRLSGRKRGEEFSSSNLLAQLKATKGKRREKHRGSQPGAVHHKLPEAYRPPRSA